jgi:predicted  nucleic acid-binding Zn-ribbon protein
MTSNLMTVAADLLALQETDLALDRALARLAEIEEQTGETEELLSARRWVDAARDHLHQLATRQKDLEFDVDEVRTHAAAVESKLYGGRVTNPKELQDLDADLRSLKSQLQTREDTLLEHLEEVEGAEAWLRQAEAELERVEARWQHSQADMAADKSRLEPEAERLKQVRESQAGGVARAALGLYDLLRRRRNGAAVAGVERGMCQGCRISLPTGIIQKARSPGAIVQCVSCERILVVA